MTRYPRWTLTGGLALVLVAWLASLRLRLDYDEGVYSQTLRLVTAGRPLVSDVFSSQPPLWPYLALPGWVAGGVTGTRLWIMVWALLGLVAMWRIARTCAGPRAALATTLLVAATPAYSSTAGAIQADVPALTLALWSVALALHPVDDRRRTARLLAVGALFGLALMVKLLVAPMLVVPLLAVAAGVERGQAVRNVVTVLAVVVVVVVAVGAVFWHGGGLWDQAVGFHVASQSLWQGVRRNISTALGAPGTVVFLLAGAVAAVAVLHRRDPQRLLLVTWFVATGLFLLLHVPLFTHHLVLAVPPAALLLVRALQGVFEGVRLRMVLVGLFGVLAVSSVVEAFVGAAVDTRWNNAAVAAVDRLPTGAVVVTDNQALATAADRSVPGPLVDTSLIRISSGDLSGSDVCAQIHKADAVLLTHDGRFDALPAVAACTHALMRLSWQDSQAQLYVRPGLHVRG